MRGRNSGYSQQVLNEMARVVKLGGRVVIHESIWKKRITDMEKEELSERYVKTGMLVIIQSCLLFRKG